MVYLCHIFSREKGGIPMKVKRSTQELQSLLAQTDLADALAQAGNEITNPTPRQYLNELLIASGMDIKKLADELLLSRSFTYQIFEGSRLPGREVLLRMAFVMKLSLAETQRLLAVLRRGALYPRIHRDAVIINALEHGQDVTDVNDTLLALGETPLYDKVL